MNKLKNIEEALNITFEKEDYNKEQTNTYQIWGENNRITCLTIQDVSIENLNLFFHLRKEVARLTFINCTIKDISGLIQFEILRKLILDKVVIGNIDVLYKNKNCTISYDGNLEHVYLKNMNISHIGVLEPMAKKVDHIFITNCVIHNFYEINLFPELYDLRLNGVTIKQSQDDVIHKAKSDRNFIRIYLTDMTFDIIDLFLPISENVKHIGLKKCTINSIKNLCQFSKLERFDIDSRTVIKEQILSKDQESKFIINYCALGEERSSTKAKVNLKNLAAIAYSIKSLEFHQYVPDDMSYLIHFTQLKKLEFEYSAVAMSNFIPVAHQIKELSFVQSELKEWEQLSNFKHLKKIKFHTYPHEKGLIDFKKILPLKDWLKKLEIDEDEVINMKYIKEFSVLESLDVTVKSIEVANSILSFQSLVKLKLYVDIDIEPEDFVTFNFEALIHIEELEFHCFETTVKLRGLDNLKNLKKLTLYCKSSLAQLNNLEKLEYLRLDDDIDINKVSMITSLKTLILDANEDYEIKTLEQFPNLENLKISGTNKVNLGKLRMLKILKVQWELNLASTNYFDQLPNLEQLDLSCCSISKIKNLEKLNNLKILDLSENYNIENIDGLENLKKLEQLNLYANKISDISVLNKLPKLKEVNLADNGAEEEVFLKQLNKPEKAIFYSLPNVPFFIWKTQYFEL